MWIYFGLGHDVGGRFLKSSTALKFAPGSGLVSSLGFFEEASNLDVESIGIQHGHTQRKLGKKHVCCLLLGGPNRPISFRLNLRLCRKNIATQCASAVLPTSDCNFAQIDFSEGYVGELRCSGKCLEHLGATSHVTCHMSPVVLPVASATKRVGPGICRLRVAGWVHPTVAELSLRPSIIRASFFDLLMSLWVDRHPHYQAPSW